MIKINLIWIVVLAAIIVAFAGFIFFGLLSSKKEETKFSFLRQFPFEFTSFKLVKIFSYLVGGFSFLPLIVILPLFNEFSSLAFYSIFVTCIFGLASLSGLVITLLPTKYIKQHLISATVLMALAFLSSALTCLYSILVSKINIRFSGGDFYHILLASISGLLAVAMLVVMFSPKLKNWAKLSEEIIDNEKVFSRGKFFPLAYSEWIAIAIIFASEILFLLSMLSI